MMTMLALTLNHGAPVILGDILITSQDGSKDFSMPTHLDGVNTLGDNSILGGPIYLKQKVYIINERLCIALGGRLDDMFSFLTYMQGSFRNKIPSAEELNQEIRAYPDDKKTHLLALVILAVIEGDTIKFEVTSIGKWDGTRHEIFELLYSSGSGSEDFLTSAKKYSGGIGHTNIYNKSIAQSLDLLSKFIAFECISAESILNKWGAGFELIYFINRFKKLSEYTYVLFIGTYDNKNGLVCHPHAVFKYKYFEDILIIRAADNEKEKVFQVTPINKDEMVDNIKIPEYQSKDIILGYVIKLPDGKIAAPSFVILGKGLEAAKIELKNGRVEIFTEEWVTDFIEKDFKNRFRL